MSIGSPYSLNTQQGWNTSEQVCRINLKTLNINIYYLRGLFLKAVEDKIMCCGKHNGGERKYCPFRMNKQLLMLSSINMKY